MPDSSSSIFFEKASDKPGRSASRHLKYISQQIKIRCIYRDKVSFHVARVLAKGSITIPLGLENVDTWYFIHATLALLPRSKFW